MPRLLDRMPFPDEPQELSVRGERVRIRANQLILWVSLTIHRVMSPNPLAVPFPVILDTGHSHNFSIQDCHLTEWGGFRPDALAFLGAIRERGNRIPLRAANIWVHPNRRGTREPRIGSAPQLVPVPDGIAVYPTGEFPRLPILGLRALAENDLILTVNGRRREANMRPPIRWWPF